MKRARFGQAEALSKKQFLEVLNSLQSPRHRLIFALCWYTCERPGAVLQLRVEDCYRNAARRSPLPRILFAAPSRKDRHSREVAVSSELARELRAYQPPDSGWLFPGTGGAGHLGWSAYYKALRRAFAKLGYVGYSTYSTRRGALTTLASHGLSLRAIATISGHKSLSSLERYLASSREESQKAIELL